MGAGSETRERWRAAAARWRAHGEFVRVATEPVTRALIETAAPEPGETWVDIAGGVGDPARQLASVLGASGRLVVTDLVPDMVTTARDLLRAEVRAARVDALAAAAEALPLRTVADGISCRFGVMFFADPAIAMRELARVLEPGGRGVFAVWGSPDDNPFFTTLNAVVREAVPDFPVPDPDDPHVFRFAPRGKLAALLDAAGWRAIVERDLSFDMAAPVTHDRMWDAIVGLSVELATLVEDNPPELAAAMRADYEQRIVPWFESGHMRFPARAWIVSARVA